MVKNITDIVFATKVACLKPQSFQSTNDKLNCLYFVVLFTISITVLFNPVATTPGFAGVFNATFPAVYFLVFYLVEQNLSRKRNKPD